MRQPTPRVKHSIGCAIACFAAALVSAGAATAKPTWLPSKPLAAGSGEAMAEIAADGAGQATAVWSTGGAESAVEAATRAPFGSFGPAVRLSPQKAEVEFPEVAIDAEGVATVVWANLTSGTVEEATLDGGGVPSTSTALSGAVGALFPSVSVSSAGAAIVSWQASGEGDRRIEAAYRSTDGKFGSPHRLSPKERSVEAFSTSGIGDGGEGLVAWTAEGEHATVEVASIATGGALRATTTFSGIEDDAANPVVAVNAVGDAAVAWSEGEESAANECVRLATRPSGGAFGPAVTVSAEGSNAEFPQVAIDASGEPTVAWMDNAAVIVAEGPSAGPFAKQRLGFPASFPSLSEDGAGDALVAWEDPEERSAEASFRPAGGGFAAPHEISPATEPVEAPVVPERPPVAGAVLGDGDALAVFALEGAGAPSVAMLDAAGPQLNALSMPAEGIAGEPVAFSVSPVDQITSVASTNWIFGDATSVAGASVQHTFAEPGTYTVAVTSADASGNETTRTGKITISPPAPARFAGARLISGSTRANEKGGFRLKVRCVASTACVNGLVRLTLNVKADGLPAATFNLGKDKFKLAAGARTYVTFRLKPSLLKLLRKRRRFNVSALVEASTYRGQVATSTGRATVRAPKARKKQRRRAGARR